MISATATADQGDADQRMRTIVSAIAAHDDTAPETLTPPLHDVIDADALTQLFQPTTTRGRRTGHIRFEYNGHSVDVTNRAGGRTIAAIDATPTSGFDAEAEAVEQFSGAESIVEAILSAIETATSTRSTDGAATDAGRDDETPPAPLYEAVDPEALAMLARRTTVVGSDWQVSFLYRGCTVAVTSDGTIEVAHHASEPPNATPDESLTDTGCPSCGEADEVVINQRPDQSGGAVRAYECPACTTRWAVGD